MDKPINILTKNLIRPIPPLDSFQSFYKLRSAPVTYYLSWNSNGYCVWWNIMSNDCASTNDSAITYSNFMKNLCACGNPNIISNFT